MITITYRQSYSSLEQYICTTSSSLSKWSLFISSSEEYVSPSSLSSLMKSSSFIVGATFLLATTLDSPTSPKVVYIGKVPKSKTKVKSVD